MWIAAAASAATPQYQIFDLGVIQAGDTASQGFGISPGGVAVGRSVRSNASQALRWTAGGGLVGLPNLAGRNHAVSNDANDYGIAVGTAATTLFGSSRLPVIWNEGVVSQLQLPSGETIGDANGVNALAVAVGSVDGGSLQQAVIYNGAYTTLITQTTSTGCFFVTAFGINDSGRIVGQGIDPNNAARNVGIVYEMGAPSAFEVGALPGANGALAFAVSNNGHVVGSSMMNQGSGLPFIYSDGAGMRAIPLAAGTSQGSARGVNSAGWVVGQDSSAFSIPFLWDGGTTYRLADLLPAGSGWDLETNTSSSALGISESGVIVGTGVHNGETHAYAMVPVQATPTPTPGPVTHLVVNAPTNAQFNRPFFFTVSARDAFENVVPGYAGTVHYTSTPDSQTTLPPDGPLTNGTGTRTATVHFWGTYRITATDTANPAITGTSNMVSVTIIDPTATPTPPPAPTASPTPTPTPFPTPSPGAEADIAALIADSPDPVTVGQNLTYTITVFNGGRDAAASVSMRDVLPTSVNFVSVTPSQGSCTGTREVICSLGGLLAFNSATVTLVVSPRQAGPLTNVAEAQTGAAHDPVSSNNFAVASTTVLSSGTPTPPLAFDGFDPNANGPIYAVLVQPDGKILLGGAFTTLSPNGGAAVPRKNIARLNTDGTLDAAFDPSADFPVHNFALQPDGKILVGGEFTSIGGQTRHKIARLDPTTGQADSFNPNPNSFVSSIAVQTDGKILVGGYFDSISGVTRHHLARLDPATGMADSFDPNVDNYVYALAVQTDGKILVAGGFTSVGGQTRKSLARLDPATGIPDSFNPNANSSVNAIAVQPDGRILAGGYFTNIGGQTRNCIARLDPTTGLADSFNPSADGYINSIALQADGKILVGGAFFSIGGQARNRIARLDPTTGLADSFNPNANSATSDAPVGGAPVAGGTAALTPQTPPFPTATPSLPDVKTIAVQMDGKILVGGAFTTLAPNGGATVTRNRIARLEIDGRVDRTLNLNMVASGSVDGTAIQPDGKILIGGNFSSILGVPRNRLARLNTDGTLDMGFNPNADAWVFSIALQADGKVLVGGLFASIGGQARTRMARLDATTGLADSFAPNPNGTVDSIAVQADGKILVSGNFTVIAGDTRNYIARLDPATGSADSFNPNANGAVQTAVVQADGKILVSGAFTSIGGQTRHFIARLDPITGLADSFDPNANNFVLPITVQPDGKVLAGGFFEGVNGVGGQTRNFIARLDATTGLADSFDPNADHYVFAIAAQADGKILAGGRFTSIGGQNRGLIARLDGTTGQADSFDPIADGTVLSIGIQADGKILTGGVFTTMSNQPRAHFARLSNDTAALQHLGVTESTVTWTRGGSSPQFTRVAFEYSSDNLNYTPLGNGTAAGSNWTLTGLNFPVGQNFYVRARGYHRTGVDNGSESITESVRNAFIAGTPSPTPTPSTKALNLSTRMRVQTGNNVGIGGFIITGTAPKNVAVRGIGPTLGAFGISDALLDPTLELRDSSGALIKSNDDWQENAADAAQLTSLGLAPQNSKESGLVATLQPGSSYTAILAGKNQTAGVGLVEIYDVNQTTDSQLANISTRSFVLTGNNVTIAGFILGGSNDPRIVVRGLGPSLAQFGLSPVLADPTLELRDNNGTLLIANNDWQDDPTMVMPGQLVALGLAPQDNKESGIVLLLPPGAYTAILAGKNGGTGIGLVEIYNVH